MAHKIKSIREALDEIKANKNFHLKERLEETHDLFTTWRVRETHSFVPSDEVIGRDDDKKAILKLVLNDIGTKENLSTVSIVGIGGLGKTTLAQLVFNDKDVQNHFEEKMWVCSANVFEVKLLVEKMIKSVTSESPDQNLDMEQLQNQLRALIDGKRFLLVLDDVWNEDEEKWLGLERLLRGGARGSRVLITTRSEMVAKITRTVCPYLLSGLNGEKSWSLFQVVAFEKGKEPSETSSLVEELTISNCDNLKGWWPGKGGGTNNNGEAMVSIVEHQHQISFPKLLVLYINNCPNLTSMPLFPNLESLRLYGASSEPLRQTIMMRNDSVAATSASSFSAIHSSCCFSPLSKLKFLILSDVQDIEFLLMVIGNLSSLESLKIELCLNLALLPDGIGDLSSLVSLVIQDCPYLVSVPEEIGNLLSLETLTIWGCPNLETLPEGLCNLISLQSLTVQECHNLTSLPKGICNLPFLKFVNGQDWMCISAFTETGLTQDYITTSASTGTSYGQIESNTHSSE